MEREKTAVFEFLTVRFKNQFGGREAASRRYRKAFDFSGKSGLRSRLYGLLHQGDLVQEYENRETKSVGKKYLESSYSFSPSEDSDGFKTRVYNTGRIEIGDIVLKKRAWKKQPEKIGEAIFVAMFSESTG